MKANGEVVIDFESESGRSMINEESHMQVPDDYIGEDEYAYGEEEYDFDDEQAGTMRDPSENTLYETRGTLDHSSHKGSMSSQSGRKRPAVAGENPSAGFCGTGSDKACCTIFWIT